MSRLMLPQPTIQTPKNREKAAMDGPVRADESPTALAGGRRSRLRSCGPV
jgi:hypothetical protein